MSIILDGSGLTIEKIVRIARIEEKVEIDNSALERIKICRAMLEDKIKAKEIMYGVNTGIGEFSEIVLDDDQVKDFQKYLIYNHSAGIGESTIGLKVLSTISFNLFFFASLLSFGISAISKSGLLIVSQ